MSSIRTMIDGPAYRAHLIETGVLVPADRVFNQPTLRLDEKGHRVAQETIENYWADVNWAEECGFEYVPETWLQDPHLVEALAQREFGPGIGDAKHD